MSLGRGRRTFVYLHADISAAVLHGHTGRVATYRAYEMTCARKLAINERRWRSDTTPPATAARELRIGRTIASRVTGDVCYAFYSKTSNAIKIGRSTDVLRRWPRLETASGMPLQLLIIWLTTDSRTFESSLFSDYAEYRRIGEWFAADGVLSDLRVRFGRTTPIHTREVSAPCVTASLPRAVPRDR